MFNPDNYKSPELEFYNSCVKLESSFNLAAVEFFQQVVEPFSQTFHHFRVNSDPMSNWQDYIRAMQIQARHDSILYTAYLNLPPWGNLGYYNDTAAQLLEHMKMNGENHMSLIRYAEHCHSVPQEQQDWVRGYEGINGHGSLFNRTRDPPSSFHREPQPGLFHTSAPQSPFTRLSVRPDAKFIAENEDIKRILWERRILRACYY